MKCYLGVDLHRTQFVVCTRLKNGQHQVRQWRIGEPQEFVEQLQSENEIAVEAMGTTARFHDAVVGRVSRVVVVNPHQFKVFRDATLDSSPGSPAWSRTRFQSMLSCARPNPFLPNSELKENNSAFGSIILQTAEC